MGKIKWFQRQRNKVHMRYAVTYMPKIKGKKSNSSRKRSQ